MVVEAPKPQTLNLRWTPHPVIVTIRDNRDYIRVLLYSYYATLQGRGPPNLNPLRFRAPASFTKTSTDDRGLGI